MRSGDLAVKIGDGGDHGRPSLGRRVIARPVIAARMETKTRGTMENRNAALAQIDLRWSAGNRTRHGEQPPPRFRRSRCSRRMRQAPFRFGLRSRQAEKTPGLNGDVAKVSKPATFPDHVEQIAMIPRRRRIRPFPRRALAGFSALQPHEHRAARRVPDVTDQPIISLAATVGKIMTAHRLGLARETMRQLRRIARHLTPLPARKCATVDSAP